MTKDMPQSLPDPRYNSASAQAIEHLFETKGAASRWLTLCQAVAPRRSDASDTRFYRDGVELLDGIGPQKAAEILERLKAERDAAIADGRQTEEEERIHVADPPWALALLEGILTPEVERRLEHKFGSAYFVYYVQFSRHPPTRTGRMSIGTATAGRTRTPRS